MNGGSSCLGDVVAALVDGELDHPARERAQRHLSHCEACRAEVDAQRRLKSRLAGLPASAVPDQNLTTRLLGLAVPGVEPVRTRPTTWTSPRWHGHRRTHRRRRRIAAGSAFVAVGLTAAFALGSPPTQRPSTPLDPGTDQFVTEFVGTTSDVVPARRASLTNGGVGSGR